MTPPTQAEIQAIFDTWAAKSKKICAICEAGLPRGVSSITVDHPNSKSKKIKVCCDCYSLMREEPDA